jgi:RsiW-degrading membrane proteinase PrsW (M82 family)
VYNLLLAIVPPIFILLHYWRQDRRRPEPQGLIWKVFFMGCLSVIPIAVIEMGLTAVIGPLPFWPKLLAESFVVAALTEEFGKRLVVQRYAFNHKAFDEVHDGVLYTIVASLGFACLENIMYSIGNPTTGLLRAFTAVPLHALASGLMGYYMGRAKFAPADERGGLMQKGLLTAVGVHGFYDFVVMSESAMAFLAIPLLLGGFQHLRSRLKQVEALDAATFGEAA